MGKKYYPLSLVMGLTFKPNHIHPSLWGHLSYMFADGDQNNTHPSNLILKTPKPLEPPGMLGYSYIPGYTGYAVSKDGVVKNVKTGKIASLIKTETGYVRVSVTPDLGNRTQVFVHRALCLAWKHYPATVDLLFVNHIDENPSNNDLDNLEWITPRGNQVHSNRGISREKVEKILQNEKCLDASVLVRNVKSNRFTIYENPRQAALAIGVSQGHLYYMLRKSPGDKIWRGHIQVQWLSELSSWKDHQNIDKEELESRELNSVLMLNVITGVETKFPSARKCAEFLGYSELTIWVRLKNNNQKVWSDGYMFKRGSDPTPWRKVEDPYKEIEESQLNTPVRCKNIFTNEVMSFEGISECARHLNIPIFILMARRIGSCDPNMPYLEWQFKFDDSEFRSLSAKQLKYFSILKDEGKAFRGKGYIFVNRETGEEKIYTDVKKASQDFGIGRSYIWNIAKNQGTFRDQWTIRFYFENDEDPY